MGSILTNNSAMVALQTLSSINKGLGKVQSEVATGLKVGQAKDNAATFAISQVMRSDVKGFNAISETLSLGSSTVAVASSASKAIGETLNEIKGKIVSAQQDNVDRQAIQDEITALTNQVTSIVNAAQFNGLNLVDGSVDGGSINVLSSLDRANSGAVTSSNITVDAQNLSTTAGTALTAAAFADSTGAPGTLAASGGTVVIDTAAFQGGGAALASDNTAANLADDAALLAGDQVSFTIGDATTGQTTATYTIKEGDTMQAVVSGLNASFESNGLDANFALDLTTAEELTITNNSNADIAFSFEATRGTGALASLSSMDVTTANGAATALQDIEVAIGATIDAQAAFGTAENRIEIQGEFMSKLIDSFKSGIGTLVDSDLEEASARLQSLQVQQQLGTQALSIANQAPQSILSLFR